MSDFPKTLKDLCTPAMIYFVISILSLIMILFQNLGNNNSYNVGSFSCRVPNTGIVFVVLYSLMFIEQPMTQSPNDAKFFELVTPIATFLTGILSGIMLGKQEKEEKKEEEAPALEPAKDPLTVDEDEIA